MSVERSQQRKIRSFLLFVLVALILALGGTLDLERAPPLWWDEGWTLTVARNWVEQGHYGQFQAGVPASGGLEAAFPVTAPVALSFSVLGVGVWQGRLVGVLFTLGALALLFFLGSHLYNRAVAWGTLFVLLLMTGHPQINTLLNGRQVLADVPVVFYLLAGYTGLYIFWKQPWISLPLASFFWGLALIAKAQTLPFLVVAIGVPLALCLGTQRWKSALWFSLAALGSWLASKAILWIQAQVLAGHTLPPTAIQAFRSLVAIVPSETLRIYALSMVLLFALPLAAGLIWQGWRFWRTRFWLLDDERITLIELSLWSLSGSWFAWYLLLSNGGERYLASPVALGSLFTAKMLYDLSQGYQLRVMVRRISALLTGKERSRTAFGGSFALLLVVYGMVIAGLTYWITLRSADTSAQTVAEALNHQVPAGSLVESYDSEIFFFLNQPYHYPPDQVHGDLLRRYLLDAQHPIAYNPLAADPDYLVVGPVSAKWRLYTEVLAGGAFRPLLEQGSYTIYERIRP